MPPIQEDSEDKREEKDDAELSFHEKLDKACGSLKWIISYDYPIRNFYSYFHYIYLRQGKVSIYTLFALKKKGLLFCNLTDKEVFGLIY